MEGTEAAWGRCGGSFPTKEGQLPLSSDVLLNVGPGLQDLPIFPEKLEIQILVISLNM